MQEQQETSHWCSTSTKNPITNRCFSVSIHLKAVDEQLRGDRDERTIGILLCKTRDRMVVEYALSDIHKPTGPLLS